MANRAMLFLCSGGGGNLRFMHEALRRGWIPGWSRIAVIADRECRATAYAREHGLPVGCENFDQDGQKKLIESAERHAPDLVITTVHRILADQFILRFRKRILNLHYSLLPAFGGSIGKAPVKCAMDYGVCMGGCTVHQVSEVLDGGTPVVQVAIPFAPDEHLEALIDLEFRVGCLALLQAVLGHDRPHLQDWRGRSFAIKGSTVLMNPYIELPVAIPDEAFWQTLK